MIRNYEYGLLDPTVNAQLIDDQMRLGHRYYNTLVEIERERRSRVTTILTGHADTEALAAKVAGLVDQHAAARLAIKATRKATRNRSETAAMRQRAKDLGAELAAAREELKAGKVAIADDPMIARAIAVADDHANARIKAERATCGAYWSTYLLAEQAMDAAKKSKAPPEFRRWSGNGRVSVQLQGGLDLAALWGGDTQIEIRPVSPDAHDPGKPRGVRRLASRTILRMRVRSTDKGKPEWAEWPMILHRAIPEGSVIKTATVIKRRRDCRRWDWRLILTIDIPDTYARRAVPDRGAIALNLGWAITKGSSTPHEAETHATGSIRAGYVLSDDGAIDRPVLVDRSVIDRVEKSEAIRSQRDKDLDAMRALLVPWLRAHEKELPEWIVEKAILSRAAPRPTSGDGTATQTEAAPRLASGDMEEQSADVSAAAPAARLTIADEPSGSSLPHEARRVKLSDDDGSSAPHEAEIAGSMREARRTWHVAMWKSPSRFRAIAFYWRAHRFAGDDAGYDLLEKWRYRDEHLERYESGMRRGALLDRRERYRILAADLAGTYKTLVIDDFDLRAFQELPAPESDKAKVPTQRRNQRHAAGSELRDALKNAFGAARLVKMTSADVTRTCHACGVVNADWDRAAGREHACDGCGVTWDQDRNACANLLAREKDGDGERGAAPKKKESRTERMLRSKREKKEAREREEREKIERDEGGASHTDVVA